MDSFHPDGLFLLMIDATARGTILLAAALMTTHFLRRSSAALRHRVWVCSLLGLIALPVVSLIAPRLSIPVLPASPPQVVSSVPGARSFELAEVKPARSVREHRPRNDTVVQVNPSPRNPAPASQKAAVHTVVPRLDNPPVARIPPSRSWPWAVIGLTLWSVGFIAFLAPTLVGLVGNELRRVKAKRIATGDLLTLAEELRSQLSLRRPVELRQSRESLIPLTWGVFRPVILLPEASHSWPDARKRTVLLHELAHVERLDTLFQIAGRLATALYWFHPLAWYALHRLRTECEHACDDRVVATGERPADYAEQLLELVRTLRVPRWSVAVALSRRNILEERMIALFDDDRSHLPLNRASGRKLMALSVVVFIGLALIQPRPRAVANPIPSPLATMTADDTPAKTNAADATGRIEGRVVLDNGGAAAAAAEVLLLFPPPNGQEYYTHKFPIRRATTNANGAFVFEGLPAGKYRVWANLGKLTSRPKRSDGATVVLTNPGEAARPLELRLVNGVAVSVVVKDRATERPIPDATVHLTWSDYDADLHTDRDGGVVLQPMRAEEWQVEAWAPGFARESQPINLKNGADAKIEFHLGPGADLEGVVRDAAGKPLAAAGVSASVAGRYQQIAYVESDAHGRYRLPYLPRDVGLQLYVSKSEYVARNVPAQVGGSGVVLDLTLEPRPDGGSIVGVVLDHNGKPISGAELINMGNSTSDTRETKTGQDGRFRLDNLYVDRNFGKEILVKARGTAPKRLKVETGPRDKPAEATITLDAGHRITGRVVDEKGNPLQSVRVYFAHGNHAFSDGGHVDTDKDGRFNFDSLPPNCPFSFVKTGYSEFESRTLELDTNSVITITMKPAGVILGKAVDAKTGRPIPACNVRVTYSSTRQNDEPSVGLLASVSDPGQYFQSADGTFQLADLVVGMPLQVTVSARGYENTLVERVVVAHPDEARADEYKLVPLDPASLRSYRGQLLNTNGKPIAGAQLRLIAATDRTPQNSIGFPFNWSMIESGQIAQQPKITRFLSGVTDKEGQFEFAGVPRKDHVELVWWAKGIAPGRRDQLEKSGDDQPIHVRTSEPARIMGTIDRKVYADNVSIQVTHPGMSLPDITVQLKPGETTFEIGDLAPIDYHVSVMSPPEHVDISGGFTIRPLATEPVSLKPGEVQKISFGKSSSKD